MLVREVPIIVTPMIMTSVSDVLGLVADGRADGPDDLSQQSRRSLFGAASQLVEHAQPKVAVSF